MRMRRMAVHSGQGRSLLWSPFRAARLCCAPHYQRESAHTAHSACNPVSVSGGAAAECDGARTAPATARVGAAAAPPPAAVLCLRERHTCWLCSNECARRARDGDLRRVPHVVPPRLPRPAAHHCAAFQLAVPAACAARVGALRVWMRWLCVCCAVTGRCKFCWCCCAIVLLPRLAFARPL